MTLAPLRDVAAYLGKSERTLRRWVDLGLLPDHRDDAGRRLIPVQAAVRVEGRIRTRRRARPPVL